MLDERRAGILSCASRIGNSLGVEAVEGAFGGDIDCAMLIMTFGAAPGADKGRRPGALEEIHLSSRLVPLILAGEQNRRWGIKISRAAARVETAGTKKPGAVSRPGTTRQFQFHG
jgi:hypothetical protein